jgi:hypothetical protein
MLGWTTYLIKSVPVYRDLPVQKAVLYNTIRDLLEVISSGVMVPKWVRRKKKTAYIQDNKTKITVPICALGGSVATAKTGLTAEVIEVHSIKS